MMHPVVFKPPPSNVAACSLEGMKIEVDGMEIDSKKGKGKKGKGVKRLGHAERVRVVDSCGNRVCVSVSGPLDMEEHARSSEWRSVRRSTVQALTYDERGRLHVTVSRAPAVALASASLPAGAPTRDAAATITAALVPSLFLERYPKSVIECHVYVEAAAAGHVGCTECAAVLATSLALALAGIEMRDVVTATHLSTDSGYLLMAAMSSLGEVTVLESGGALAADAFDEAVAACSARCSRLRQDAREHLTYTLGCTTD
jgi:ribonuclease PH